MKKFNLEIPEDILKYAKYTITYGSNNLIEKVEISGRYANQNLIRFAKCETGYCVEVLSDEVTVTEENDSKSINAVEQSII